MSADQIFRQLQSDRDNSRCFDCGRPVAQWASVNHGIYLCLECSGQHRSLGTHISFVRSLSMDSWTMGQLNLMKSGGNRRFSDFISNYSFPPSYTLQQKYYSRAVEYYRQLLKAEAEGRRLTYPPPTLQEGLQPYMPIPMTNYTPTYSRPTHYYENYQRDVPEDSSFWGSAKNIFGTVLEKANELAYSTVETFNEQGVIGTIRNATSTAVEKSKEIIDTIADSDSFSTVKDKSWEYYNSISQKASDTFNRIRGNPTEENYSYTGYNRPLNSQSSYQPTQSYGAYQPPSTTYSSYSPTQPSRPASFSSPPTQLSHSNTFSSPSSSFQSRPSQLSHSNTFSSSSSSVQSRPTTFSSPSSFSQPRPVQSYQSQPKPEQSFFQPRAPLAQPPAASNPRTAASQADLLSLDTPSNNVPDLLTGD